MSKLSLFWAATLLCLAGSFGLAHAQPKYMYDESEFEAGDVRETYLQCRSEFEAYAAIRNRASYGMFKPFGIKAVESLVNNTRNPSIYKHGAEMYQKSYSTGSDSGQPYTAAGIAAYDCMLKFRASKFASSTGEVSRPQASAVDPKKPHPNLAKLQIVNKVGNGCVGVELGNIRLLNESAAVEYHQFGVPIIIKNDCRGAQLVAFFIAERPSLSPMFTRLPGDGMVLPTMNWNKAMPFQSLGYDAPLHGPATAMAIPANSSIVINTIRPKNDNDSSQVKLAACDLIDENDFEQTLFLNARAPTDVTQFKCLPNRKSDYASSYSGRPRKP